MKIEIGFLLNVLEKVMPGVGDDAVTQTDCFLFTDSHVHSYNDEISIRFPLEKFPFQGAVPAKQFYGILKKLPGDVIEIESESNQIIILGKKKARIGIRTMVDELTPVLEFEEPKEWYDLPSNFNEAVHLALGSASKDLTMPILAAVHVEGTMVEATDNFLLMRYFTKDTVPMPEFIIPRVPAKSMYKYKFLHVGFTKNWLHFKDSDGVVYSCRTYTSTKYPDISEHIKVTGPSVQLPIEILNALQCAEIISKDEDEPRVEVMFENKKVVLKAESSHGWVEYPIKYEYDSSVEDGLTFIIGPTVLEKVLKQGTELIIGENAIAFEGENFIHIAARLNK